MEYFARFFLGETTLNEAYVYVDAPTAGADVLELDGTIAGPRCQFARTLPASLALRPMSPDLLGLLHVIVPDPCLWTPDLPFLYDVALTCERTGAPATSVEFATGIRPLGVQGRSVYLARQRIVLRGTRVKEHDRIDWPAHRAALNSLLLCSPSEEICHHASDWGIPLLVIAGENQCNDFDALARMSRWPAVFAVVLDERPANMAQARVALKNTLIGQSLHAYQAEDGDIWGDVVLVEIGDETLDHATLPADIPLLMYSRRGLPATSPANIRARAEQLQSQLAAFGDFAGYFVS